MSPVAARQRLIFRNPVAGLLELCHHVGEAIDDECRMRLAGGNEILVDAEMHRHRCPCRKLNPDVSVVQSARIGTGNMRPNGSMARGAGESFFKDSAFGCDCSNWRKR